MGTRLLDRLRRRGANSDPTSAGSSSEPPSRFDRRRMTPRDEPSARAPLLDDTWDAASTIAPSLHSMSTTINDDSSVITKKKSSDTLATIRKTKPKDGKHGSKSSYRYPQDCPELPGDRNWVRSPLPCDTSSTMDPLVAAIYYNSTHSPLLRLPDKVLTKIMHYLDGASTYSLRHTSRTFLRLFSSDEFQKRQVDRFYQRTWSSQWVSAFDKTLAEYYRRDAYCPACAHILKQKSKDPRFEALFHQNLWCAACAEDHPAALFSAWQRRESDESRICIGHEGYFRICQHRTISWLDVQEWVAAVAHLDAYGVDSVSGNICKHPDHLCTCNCGKVEFGQVELRLTNRGYGLSIGLTSQQHLPGMQDPVSSLDVRRILDAAQEAGGKYLGPTHMTMFDPNNCTCLTYPGSESVEMPLGEARAGACRERVLKGKKEKPMAFKYHFGSFTGSSGARELYSNVRAGKCFWGCDKMDFRYTTRIRLRFVNKDNARKIDPAWYRAVSPESYEMAEDWESRHVLWCPDARCRNYHGNSRIDRFWGWKKR